MRTGRGYLGEDTFRRLSHDRRFAGLPILIEIEKSKDCEKRGTILPDPLDMQN